MFTDEQYRKTKERGAVVLNFDFYDESGMLFRPSTNGRGVGGEGFCRIYRLEI